MGGLLVRIMTVAGPIIYKIPGAGAVAQRIAAQLVKNGGKIIKAPKGGFKGPTKPATPANVAKVIKDLKQSKTGAGRPAAKKPTTKPKENIEQFGPGGSTMRPIAKPKPKPEKVPEQFGPGAGGARPMAKPKPKPKKPTAKPGSSTSGGKAKKGGLKTKKSPFAKKTKAEKIAAAKKAAKQAQRGRDLNKKNPSRDSVGKYNVRPLSKSNTPKSGGARKGGLKTKLKKKSGAALAGLGVAAVKVDNLTQEELKIKKKDNLKPRTSGPNKGSRGSEGDRFKNRTMKKPTPKKIPVVKAPPGPSKERPKESQQPKETFGQAFNRNRKAGKPTFPYKGSTYTTRLKEESIKDHKKKFGVTGKY
tara:strand:+ start:75 stop:1154 length:1080 start_codon:yes stop_codon:yes gene_type:complete